MKLKIGDPAPDFSLSNQNGKTVSLKDLRAGGGLVLIAFYPGDFTSVCTEELVCFRQDFSEFNGLDCKIVGISCDSVESHKDFVEKFKFPFDLLSDDGALVSKAYGCKLPLVNKSNRGIFILNEKGKIGYAHIETLPVFKRSNAELLDAIRAIRSA